MSIVATLDEMLKFLVLSRPYHLPCPPEGTVPALLTRPPGGHLETAMANCVR